MYILYHVINEQFSTGKHNDRNETIHCCVHCANQPLESGDPEGLGPLLVQYSSTMHLNKEDLSEKV